MVFCLCKIACDNKHVTYSHGLFFLLALMFCLHYNCGLEQALIWSKMSTGLPIEIKSSMKGQNYTSFCRLDIDIHK